MKGKFRFRIWQAMAERDIRTATQLAARLNEEGYKISSSHLTRYLRDDPPALQIEFLSAVASALNCDAQMLFQWVPASQAEQGSSKDGAVGETTKQEVKAIQERKKDEVRNRMVGPKLTALPPKVRK